MINRQELHFSSQITDVVFTGWLLGQWSYSCSSYLFTPAPPKTIQQIEKFLRVFLKSAYMNMYVCISLARMIPEKLYVFITKKKLKTECAGPSCLCYFQVRHPSLLVSQRRLRSQGSLKLTFCQFSMCIFGSATWKGNNAAINTAVMATRKTQCSIAVNWAQLLGPATICGWKFL